MERILENSEIYKNALEKSITVTTVLLVVAVIIAIALAFVFAYWWKTIINGSDDKKKAKSPKKVKRKKDKKKSKRFELVEWYVALAAVVVMLLFALISGIQYIMDLRYDIENEAFILHDGAYSVVVTSEPVGRHSYAARYYLSFDNGTEEIEISVADAAYEELLQESEHDDVAFVYSEKSKVLLDMWRK